MKPAEFIDFAKSLVLQHATTPALLRSATSRAYYGAFHLSKEFVESLTQAPTAKHDAHIWLIGSRFEAAHQAGQLLGDLNNARIIADYKLADSAAELPNFARKSVERAIVVQQLLQDCVNAPADEIIARRNVKQ